MTAFTFPAEFTKDIDPKLVDAARIIPPLMLTLDEGPRHATACTIIMGLHVALFDAIRTLNANGHADDADRVMGTMAQSILTATECAFQHMAADSTVPESTPDRPVS